MTIQLPNAVRHRLEVWAREGYPHEICGMLIGGKSGSRVHPAPNASSTAVRCRPGPSVGATARPSFTYRRQKT